MGRIQIYIVLGFLCIFVIFSGCTGNGIKEAHTDFNGEAIAPALLQQGKECFKNRDVDSAIFYFKKVVFTTNNNTPDSILATAHSALGKSYLYLQNYDSADHYLNQAFITSGAINNYKFMADAKITLGVMADKQKDADHAIMHTLQAADIALKENEYSLLSTAYLNLGRFYLENKNMADSGIFYYQQNISLAATHNTYPFYALNSLGIFYDMAGNTDSALYYYHSAMWYAEESDKLQDKADITANLGSFYDERGDKPLAIKYYYKARDLYAEMGDEYTSNLVKTNLGLLYLDLNETEKAIEIFNEVYEYGQTTDSPELIEQALLSLAKAGINTQDFKLVKQSVKKLDELPNALDAPAAITEVLILKGKIQQHEGRPTKAMQYFLQAEDLAVDYNILSKQIHANDAISQLYLMQGQTEKALAPALESYRLATTGSYPVRAIAASDLLVKIYKQQNNFKEATKYLEVKQHLKDSILNVETRKELTALMLQRKETELASLKEQKAIDQAGLESKTQELAAKKWQNYTTASIAVLFLLLAGIFMFSRQRLKKGNKLLHGHNHKIGEQNKQLTELNQEKDRLMHVIAHDLRNPLNGIFGLIHLIEYEGKLTQQQKEYIALVKDSVQHGVEIINGLLSMEQNSSAELKFEETNITELLHKVISGFSDHAHKKEINIEQELHENVLAITDKNKLTRIYENLISNAIKFSTPGKSIEVTLTTRGKAFDTTVKDRGPGFTVNDQANLFQKFKKLSARPTAGENSTGLGLSIVKDFVTILDGQIKVTNRDTGGAEIFVSLPTDPLIKGSKTAKARAALVRHNGY